MQFDAASNVEFGKCSFHVQRILRCLCNDTINNAGRKGTEAEVLVGICDIAKAPLHTARKAILVKTVPHNPSDVILTGSYVR